MMEGAISRLTGLRPWDYPLSALVAYGTLRILTELQGKEARLGFEDTLQGPVPAINGLREDALLEALTAHLRCLSNRYQEVIGEAKKIKDLYSQTAEDIGGGDHGLFGLLQHYFIPIPKTKSGFAPTPFDTTDGQQKFFDAFEKAIEAAKRLGLEEGLERVLFGEGVLLYPGESAPKVTQLGWHETQYRNWADRARNPIAEKSHERIRIHPVALLLAWEALPLYPMVLESDLRPRAVGFFYDTEETPVLVLPLPKCPVDIVELRALIAAAPRILKNKESRLRDVEIWSSPRLGRKGQRGAYPTFAHAEPAPHRS